MVMVTVWVRVYGQVTVRVISGRRWYILGCPGGANILHSTDRTADRWLDENYRLIPG